jgi:hypothetical protein
MMLAAAIVMLFVICIVAALTLYASTAVERVALSPELEEQSIEWELVPNADRSRSSESIPLHHA